MQLFEGLWGEVLAAVIGIGLTHAGLVGLALGGDLPPFRVPKELKGYAKFAHFVAFAIGLTLLTDAAPDLVERVWLQLTR